jgi:hypothetical protein
MRLIVSIVFEFAPLFLIYLWLEDKTNWSIVSIFGCSLMASAIASYIGVMYFDLTVIGRYSMLEGKEAWSAIEGVSVIGAGLTLIGLIFIRER